jgi:hypothetical protein
MAVTAVNRRAEYGNGGQLLIQILVANEFKTKTGDRNEENLMSERKWEGQLNRRART